MSIGNQNLLICLSNASPSFPVSANPFMLVLFHVSATTFILVPPLSYALRAAGHKLGLLLEIISDAYRDNDADDDSDNDDD